MNTETQFAIEPQPEPTPAPVERKRVIISYCPYGSTKERYVSALIKSYSGNTIWLETVPHGEHEFSREDGRWIAGACLNLESGRLHMFDALEASIQAGSAHAEWEWRTEEPRVSQ